MFLAAEILVLPSRRLAAAVLVMALVSNLTLGAWLIAVWHSQGPADPQIRVVAASGLVAGVWIASCVLIWRWWRARGAQRLVIEGNGEAFWLDRPDLRGVNGVQSPGAFVATTDGSTAANRPQGARRLRPVPGSLAWPGIISLQFVADAAQQHHERWSGASSPTTMVVLTDSVSMTEHRALALWMHWLQRKGAAPRVRVAPDSVRL